MHTEVLWARRSPLRSVVIMSEPAPLCVSRFSSAQSMVSKTQSNMSQIRFWKLVIYAAEPMIRTIPNATHMPYSLKEPSIHHSTITTRHIHPSGYEASRISSSKGASNGTPAPCITTLARIGSRLLGNSPGNISLRAWPRILGRRSEPVAGTRDWMTLKVACSEDACDDESEAVVGM